MLFKTLLVTLALAISVAAIPIPSDDPTNGAVAGLGGAAGVITGQSPGSKDGNGDGNGNKDNGNGNGNNAGSGAGTGNGNGSGSGDGNPSATGNGSGNSGNSIGTVSVAPSVTCNSKTPSQISY